MPYAGDRLIHDADSHVVETPGWLDGYADPDIRDRLPALNLRTVRPGEADEIDAQRLRHSDPEYRARDADEIMLRKNWAATGSFVREDRGRALDLLGFASQLVFNTFVTVKLVDAEHDDDLGVAYGLARAHNRAIVDFCSVDARLLPVGYVPLANFERSAAMATEALEGGCAALMVPSPWTKQLESALEAFSRHEERLRRLELRPAEYVRRQVRVTPYPTEDAGWVLEQVGPEVCMFSSDYPHVEGGRNPIGRFDAALQRVDDVARKRFFVDNFVDLMGSAMARVPLPASA